MATAPETIAFLLEQMAGVRGLTARKMFGEYGLFIAGRMVAIVCDDRLFVKDRPELRAMLAEPRLERPFPRSQPYLVLEDEVDDPDRLAALMARAYDLTPEPKRKGTRG